MSWDVAGSGLSEEIGLELPERPNVHCVEQLVRAAPHRGLVAGEDVYDQRGMLLLAAGQAVDAGARERLIARRLVRPLESSLTFRDGISVLELLAAARRTLKAMPALARLLDAETEQVLAMLAQVRLRQGAATLLTALAHNRPEALQHALAVALLDAWLAIMLGHGDAEVRDAAEAGLLHDLGEFYLAPDALDPAIRLPFETWQRMCVHPLVGGALVREAGYAAQIVTAIREHHERVDGSGYPSGTTRISPLGRLLLSAEMLATLLGNGERALVRARIALQMIPGQFPPEVVDVVCARLRMLRPDAPEAVELDSLQAKVGLFLDRLGVAAQWLATADTLPADDHALRAGFASLVRRYTLALHDSGAEAMSANPHWLADDAQVADEVYRVAREMAWQLPGLHRHVALMVRARASQPQAWQPLLDALDVSALVPRQVAPPGPPPVADADTAADTDAVEGEGGVVVEPEMEGGTDRQLAGDDAADDLAAQSTGQHGSV